MSVLSEDVLELDETVRCPQCDHRLQLHRLELTRRSALLDVYVGTYWWRLVCSGDWSHKVDTPIKRTQR